jgi:hypothetical protein
MSAVFSVKLPTVDVDYIQYLQYEVNSYQLILNDILLEKNSKYKYSKENYEHFMNEFKNANMKLSLYMNEILDEYAPEYNNSLKYYYDVAFADGILNIFENKTCAYKSGGAR